MLATYPIAGMENGPVFESRANIEVFNQCNTSQDRNRILIMRREVVGRNRYFDGQNALVTSYGQRVVTVRERAFYDTINILKTGTCPDKRAPRSFARSAELVRIGGFNYIAVVGGFAPGAGVYVYYRSDFANRYSGVGPGASAEVQDIGA